ncbi:MAG: mechanosensitive ion channel [Deltaproteobacteria bacterium]|nr:mechanosensitive ion channel [Deltaproteobacteria bacterium]MBN2672026.1 mechanosensitive ion channel [Deltaproteobacteria bacterium]
MENTTDTINSTELGRLTEQLIEATRSLVITYGMRVVGAIVLIIVGYLVARVLSRKMEQLVSRSKNVDASIAAIARKATFIGVILLVLIAVLERFGVETTSFIAVLGAAGLAVGLALQGTLSNIAAGVMLLVLRPFKAGDAVQVGGGEVYIIDEIGLFVTRAHKPDCPRVMIPNAKVWGDTIVNFSNTLDDNRRFDIVFGISYSDNITAAIQTLQQLAEQDERVLDDPAPFIKVDSLGDSSVNILFRVHTKSGDWWDAKLDLTKAGKEALEAAGNTIPFPQHDVHLFNQNK